MQDIETTTRQSRNGIQFQITPTTNRQSIGDRILSRDIVPFMRSRGIQFNVRR